MRPFELDNRGKRGIALSLEQPAAIKALHRLVERADIFITNLTAPRDRALRPLPQSACSGSRRG